MPSQLLPNVPLLINGEFVQSKTTQWRDVVNPATQQVLARVPFATPDEVNAAIANAKDAFKTWRKTPIGQRARIFLKLQQLIRENIKELAAILTAEQGKSLPDAEGDVFRGLEVVEHASAIGNLQLGELANNVANGVDTYTGLQPLVVSAGITQFNFPAMIPLWMFPMAIATGNTFILKPSEQDPLVTMRLCELALDAGVPPGVLNVVHGGEDVVNAICDHPDSKAISFVGSTKVGTHVYNRACLNGKRVQCMMGAKNHYIVLPEPAGQQGLHGRFRHRPHAQGPGPGPGKRHGHQGQHPAGRLGARDLCGAQRFGAWRGRLLQRDQDAAKARPTHGAGTEIVRKGHGNG
jgi:malonate-semialdehyde dehydrogenase (acetylating) / methylmalonate-semialdehyde dehydrogenase